MERELKKLRRSAREVVTPARERRSRAKGKVAAPELDPMKAVDQAGEISRGGQGRNHAARLYHHAISAGHPADAAASEARLVERCGA